jgi:predicted PurR-regulated permease PerM
LRAQEVARQALIVTVAVVLVAAAVAVLVTAADVLLVFFAGVLLAIFLRGAGDAVSRRTGLPERPSVALVVVVLFVLLAGAGWMLASDLADQMERLGANLTEAWRQVEAWLRERPWGRQVLALLSFAQAEPQADGEMVDRAARVFSTTLGAIANLFIVLFVGLYLAFDPDIYVRGVLKLLPLERRERAAAILASVGRTLRWWLLGRAASMLVVGIVTTIGLWLLGVPLALGLGVIAALLDFVPIVGPILAAVPAVLVTIGEGFSQTLYVVLLYLGVQALEGYVLTPLIEQRSVKLPPALTIGAQVVLGVLVGALGVVFATPLTAVFVVLLGKLYIEDTLGDSFETR